MASPSKRQRELAGIVGEILAILLGVGLIALGWTGFGEMLVAIGAVGLVVSVVRLWRLGRQPAAGASPPTDTTADVT